MSRLNDNQPLVNANIEERTTRPIAMVFLGLLLGLAVIPCSWFGDTAISQKTGGWKLPGDLNKTLQISEVFAHGTGVLAILGTLWWVDRDRRRLLGFAGAVTLFSGLVANGLKAVFSRVRPHSGELVDGVESWLPFFQGSFWDSSLRSFPSGHSATAVALAIGLSIVYPRGKFLFALFAILACMQRIVSQAHYPSDVIAGASIAIICSALCLRWKPCNEISNSS